jgi:putative protease
MDISLDDNLNLHVISKFCLNNTKIEFKYKSKAKFEKAINRPIELEEVKKQLSKTGNTPFYIKEIEIDNFSNNLFIPTSKLNEIRREILANASNHLLNYYRPYKNQIKEIKKNLANFTKKYNAENRNFSTTNLESANNSENNTQLGVSVFVDNLDLIELASNYNIKKIYFDPSYLYNNSEDYFKNIKDILIDAYIKSKSRDLVWVLPSFIRDEEIDKCVKIHEDLKSKEFNIGIMTDTPGISELFNTNIYGDHNLNIWNSFACENMKESGFDSLILSSELSYNEISELKSKLETDVDNKLGLELIVHGNLEVMASKDDFSNLTNSKDLIIDETSSYAILEDKKRKKFKYKVLFDFNKKSHFRNKDCLCLIDELGKIKALGLDSIVLDCRFSNKDYSSKIISLYLEGIKDTNKKNLNVLKKEVHSITHSYLSKGNFLDGRIHEKDKN